VASKLSETATASIGWGRRNGVVFYQGKTEAAIFWRWRHPPTATIQVGDNAVPFNTEATRWLGMWLDSQLKLKEHHATRPKKGRVSMTRIRRLAGR